MKLWPFGKQVQALTRELSLELSKTFGVASQDAEQMRYVSKRGRLGTGHVNRVFIFNPAVLTAAELASATFDSLTALNKGLLFNGHIMKGHEASKGNLVVLYDRRAA